MRALFVTTTYPLKKGDSIPGFVADLATHLVSDHSIDVTVLAPHHPGAPHREIVDGVRIERFQYTANAEDQCLAYGNGIPDNVRNNPQAKWQVPGFFAAMYRGILRHLPKVDLIHAHWVEPAFVAWLANASIHKPLVLTVHSLKPKRSKLHAFTLARSDRVLFNSEYTRLQAAAKRYCCRGEVIYQGYDDSLFGTLQNDGSMRASLGIPADVPVVTAIGRLIEVKGMHVLAAAADAILSSRSDVRIVIAGDGPERSRVEEILRSCRCRDRVTLSGALNRGQVAQLMAESDLFVNPGVVDSNGRAEGLGITTIEAMASGLAVVGSRVGGIVETIEDGVTGLLAPAGDVSALAAGVGDLLDDSEKRRRMGRAGGEVARAKFRWQFLAGEVVGVYREVLG